MCVIAQQPHTAFDLVHHPIRVQYIGLFMKLPKCNYLDCWKADRGGLLGLAWVCQKIEIRSKRFKGTPSFNAIRSSWEFKALPDPEHLLRMKNMIGTGKKLNIGKK